MPDNLKRAMREPEADDSRRRPCDAQKKSKFLVLTSAAWGTLSSANSTVLNGAIQL